MSLPVLLVITDDQVIASSLISLWEELDNFYSIEYASSNRQAREKLATIHPHIIIIDYYLLDEAGTTLIKEIRQQPAYQDLPIIMSSGLDKEKEALACGANCFVLKPYDLDDLAKKIDELLGLDREIPPSQPS